MVIKVETTILAATNFSPVANNSVIYAAGLAGAIGARLLLFHSFITPNHSDKEALFVASEDSRFDNAVKRLDTLSNDIEKTFKINVSPACSRCHLEDHLSLVLRENNVALIVMGMAANTFEQDLWGNPTTLVFRNINLPLLSLPLSSKFLTTRKVLFAIDNNKVLRAQKIVWLRNVLKAVNGTVLFLCINKKIEKIRGTAPHLSQIDMIGTGFNEINYDFRDWFSSEVIEEIKLDITALEADILGIGSLKSGFWDSIIHKSKTRVMLSRLNKPLLSLPNYP